MTKKTIYIAGGTAGVVVLLVCVIAGGIYRWLSLNPFCSEDKKLTTVSSDGKYAAIVFQRDCGFAAESYAHVNLVEASKTVRPKPISGRITDGTVFVAIWYHEHLKAQWSGPRTLLIECDDCPQEPNSSRGATEQRNTWQDVIILYKLRADAR